MGRGNQSVVCFLFDLVGFSYFSGISSELFVRRYLASNHRKVHLSSRQNISRQFKATGFQPSDCIDLDVFADTPQKFSNVGLMSHSKIETIIF